MRTDLDDIYAIYNRMTDVQKNTIREAEEEARRDGSYDFIGWALNKINTEDFNTSTDEEIVEWYYNDIFGW